MTHDVVVVGSINADLLLRVERHPLPGETLAGSSGHMTAGGKGANQAVAAASRGVRIAVIGAVGDDADAETALHHLRASGVDLEHVATVPGRTGLAVVTLSPDGENSIIVVPGANASVTPDVVERAEEVVQEARVLLLQGEIPSSTTEAAARLAVASGARVVLNLAPVFDVSPDTLAAADPLVVNEHEARELLSRLGARRSIEASPLPPGLPDAAGEAYGAARSLVAGTVRSVVVTLGALGALGVSADGTFHCPALSVPVVDTTGAGDAFVGALAAELARGADLPAAVAVGTRVAAFSVQRAGAQASYPTRSDTLPDA